MVEPDDTLEKIEPLLEEYFSRQSTDFDPEKPSIPLVSSPYAEKEVLEALESMLSTYVTMGEKVEKFERKWASYLGAENGLMTNSGSSANLMALKALEKDFSDGAEVIVPAVGWSTTFFPLRDVGVKPVFVDVNPYDFQMSTEAIKSAVNNKTEAIMPVHILGNPAPMDAITDVCADHNLKLIEDCAEAHGAEFRGQKVGTFGEFGTFSFSFSHHITTTEGGMAVTDSEKYLRRMKTLRSWGRARDVEGAEEVFGSSEMDLDFAFVSQGYNVRPTEIQGAFGIHQTDKIDGFVEKRRENARKLNKRLREIDQLNLMTEKSDVKCSYLHYPLLLDSDSSHTGKGLRAFLEEKGIETRPILSGNITRHPAFQNYSVTHDHGGADHIHEKGLYISNHHYLTEKHRDYIVETVKSFFS